MTERTISCKQAKKAILKSFQKKRPIFLWGPPGIGKSEIVREATEELGGYLIDLRLSQYDPTDLRGIPYYNKDKNCMSWSPSEELPTDEFAAQYPLVVIFFEELNSAPPSVQAATYQLILDRRIGQRKLPDNVVMIAAGNRDSDRGVTYRMPAPLANRFTHLDLGVDFDSWEEWALNNKIHKDIVGYLSFSKKDLFDFDPKSSSRAFPTPRSWTFVSEFLEDEDTDSQTLMNLISGTVGEGLAVKFMAHRKIASRLPDPKDVLSGKVKDLEIKEISAMYSLVTSMCYELKEAVDRKVPMDEFYSMVDNFFRYSMDNFETEIVVMATRVALAVYKLPITATKLKNFKEFHERYGKYVMHSS